jgi:pimeloyl-ACP methyl ester carboxylesterase
MIVTAVSVTPAPVTAARGTIAWTPCPEDRSAECGVLRVPVDWTKPYGTKIDIAVARRRATDPARRVGALVINPGGPGGSGVEFAIAGSEFFSPALRRSFDLVGFDPRGVGRSSPVRCTAAVVADTPSPDLTGPAAFAAAQAFNRRLATDCRRRSGPVADHVDSLSVVRDLDALRVALGEKQLNYYGISYGTLIGQQYVDTYPGNYRAVVLDSTMDHSGGTAEFLDAEAAAAQDAFDEFVAWCARDPLCVLRGRDIRALWAGLLRRAARGTLADPVDPDAKLSAYDLITTAHGAFYGPEWFSFAYFLEAADEGTRAGTAGRRVGRRAVSPTRRAVTVENPFPAVFCQDWALPIRDHAAYVAHLRRTARLAPDMRYSPLALAGAVACLGRTAVNPQRTLRPATGPVLLLNARYDPATAFAWAVGTARQFGPQATLVRYNGWGHATYGRGPCTVAAVDRYLLRLTRPATGTHCPAVAPDPFGIGKRSAAPDEPRRWVR